MPESIEFEYFFGEESTQYTFFKVPCQLITNPQFRCLSNDAKLLYAMLLDRMSLSARNGWYDELGRVYIYYTVDEIRQDLNCGNDKALKMLAELDTNKGVGLIERIKQGQGKPTKIFVKRFTTRAVPPPPEPERYPVQPGPAGPGIPNPDFLDSRPSTFPISATPKIRGNDLEKAECNQTNQNQTDFSQTDPSIYPAAVPLQTMMERYECREEVREQIDFALLKKEFPYDDVESLLELIVDVLSSTAPTLRIGGETLPTEAVKDRFRQLEHSHIEYVIDSLQKTTTQIHNIRAYLLTALYNAPVTMGPYYSAAVRHDFG